AHARTVRPHARGPLRARRAAHRKRRQGRRGVGAMRPQAPGRTPRGREAPQRCPGAEDQPPEASEAPAREADKYDERIVAVTMPKWGLSMQLGKITSWIVVEGGDVSVGDGPAGNETEKIAGTLGAADPGPLRGIIPKATDDV